MHDNERLALLTARERAWLFKPERWTILGPWWPGPTVASGRHRTWSEQHQRILPQLEIILVLHGRGIFGIDGRLYRYFPGALLVLPPAIRHDDGFPPWRGVFTRLWLSFPYDLSVNCYRYQPGDRQWRTLFKGFWPSKEIGIRLPLIHAISDNLKHPSETARKLRLLSLVNAVIAALADPLTPGDTPEGIRRCQKIEEIRRYIEFHGGCRMTLTSLSTLFQVSPSHLSRRFKQQTGYTVHSYIDRCRMNKITEMNRTAMPRKVVAAALGFSGPAALSRWMHQQNTVESETRPFRPCSRSRAASRDSEQATKACRPPSKVAGRK